MMSSEAKSNNPPVDVAVAAGGVRLSHGKSFAREAVAAAQVLATSVAEELHMKRYCWVELR